MIKSILYSCLLIGRGVDASLIPSSATSSIQKLVLKSHRHNNIIDAKLTQNIQRQQTLSSKITKISSLGWNLDRIHNIRGGFTDSEDETSEDGEDLDDDNEEEEEEMSSESELNNLEVDSNNKDEEEDTPPASSEGSPVKLTISTNLQSSLLDQQLEFTSSRKRTVLSLKQAVSKTMRGRPPLSSLTLKFSGRLLENDEIVDDIVAEVDEDDVDSEENDDDDEDGMVKLKLTCDIVPPIDAKFGVEFREKANQMSTKELMEAYCVNMAGMMHNLELIQKESVVMMKADFEDDQEGDDIDCEAPMGGEQIQNHSLHIRKRAAVIQKHMEQSLSNNVLELMEDEHERVQAHIKGRDGAINAGGTSSSSSSSSSLEEEEIIYGLVPQGIDKSPRRGRKGKTLKGGATMNIKRTLQRNMNVNWADTTRNSLLFLFFGYFGGRNSFSRTFLLLSSPLCFFIQARPVKVAMKQLFYTIGEPPGILLSLLPAPQQAIMSLNYGKAMRELYDEKVLQGEEWYGMEKIVRDEYAGSYGNKMDLGDDEDDYDEDYDEETGGEG